MKKRIKNVHRQIITLLKENCEKKMSKYEKPNEFKKEIEKCDLIQCIKVGFLKCLNSLKIKHNKFLVLVLQHIGSQVPSLRHGLVECSKNIIRLQFLGSYWNKISYKNIKYCDNEHLKLQTCIMKQTHHKNVEIFPCR
jgi:hypothetical protein